jgi:hypothetical protein
MALLSIDLEYRTLMETTKEAIWFQDLLSKLAILKNAQVLIYCNIESFQRLGISL